MTNPESSLTWAKVKEALAIKSQYSLKIAIIEANSLYLNHIKAKGFNILNSKDSLSVIRSILSCPDDLEASISTYQKIIEGDSVELDYNKAKAYIKAYYQAMVDMKDFTSYQGMIFRFRNFLSSFKKYFYGKGLYILGGIILFIVLVVFLTDTSVGGSFVDFIDYITHRIIFSLAIAFFILFIVSLTVLILFSFKKKDRNIQNAKIIFDEEFEED